MLFGAHCSTAGGFYMAVKRARTIGASSCQIFVKNNMRWTGKAPSSGDIQAFQDARAAKPKLPVFGHAGYLINLAAPECPNREQSINSLKQELDFAAGLGLPFLVLHPGAHLGAGEVAGLKQVGRALDHVFEMTDGPVRVALENTAGQGSCLGGKLEHFAAIYDLVKTPARLGICIDTAHLFAAGYDIRTPAGWEDVVAQIKKLFGLRQVLAFHLNDSKTPLGSRVDRHAHIGEGHIGKAGFRHIVRDKRFAKQPGCIETPKSDDLHEDLSNLATLRKLAGT
jgi:deoxyribonuclease IV